IARLRLGTLEREAFAPPPDDGIHRNVTSPRELSGRPTPAVVVKRAPSAQVRSQHPAISIAIRPEAFFLVACILGDASSKIDDRLRRLLDREPKTMRGIPVPVLPSAPRRIRLDEVGERNTQLDLCLAKSLQFGARPGKLVQVHLVRLLACE